MHFHQKSFDIIQGRLYGSLSSRIRVQIQFPSGMDAIVIGRRITQIFHLRGLRGGCGRRLLCRSMRCGLDFGNSDLKKCLIRVVFPEHGGRRTLVIREESEVLCPVWTRLLALGCKVQEFDKGDSLRIYGQSKYFQKI